MSSSKLHWFKSARFGMFIHWGLYAIPGGLWKGREMEYIGEWLQAQFRIPNAEYEALAARFNPTGFCAEEWVRTAKEAGMRYIVFTAKHHEGFAMYHSKSSRFNIVDATPFGRDVLAELADACKLHGMQLGVYYSQDLDWHEFDGGDPGPQFPKNFGMSWGNDWDFPDHAAKDFNRYFNGKVIPQLTELLTGYGPISVVWFDCPVSIPREASERLARLVRELQPDCLINTRLGNGLGDFGSLGDNQLPSSRRNGAWETPGTLNDTWGFKHNDHCWKSSSEIIHLLASLADKDTNYLLNIGPQADGRFPAAAVGILRDIGRWLDRYGNAIYGNCGNPFPYDFDWGCMTVKVDEKGGSTKLNLFLRQPPSEALVLYGLKERVTRCHELGTPGLDLPFAVEPTSVPGIDAVRIDLASLPPGVLPVVSLDLETTAMPRIEPTLISQNGTLRLRANQAGIVHGQSASGQPTAASGVGAAGERQAANGHCHLDATGAMVEWHNPSDSISWNVVFLEPGRYEVEFATSSRSHSGRWTDGQTVRLSYESNGSSIQWDTVIEGRAIDTAETRCYARGISRAGVLTVTEPSGGVLSLAMTGLGAPENVNMALNEIRLTRLAGS